MPTRKSWVVPATFLAAAVLIPLAAAAARSRVPLPPTPPTAPAAMSAPAVPAPPAAPAPPAPPEMARVPRVPVPPVPPDEMDAAGPPDPEEAFEWFGDLDRETLEMAGPPACGDDVMAFAPDASDGDMFFVGDDFDGGDLGPGPRAPMARVGRPGSRHRELMEAIKLTDAQRDRLRDLHDRQRRDAIRARADLQIAALDLRRMLEEDHADRSAIESQIDKISSERAALRKGQVMAMLEAREVLTAQQRTQLKAAREKMHDDLQLRIRERMRDDGRGRRVVRIRRPHALGEDSQ